MTDARKALADDLVAFFNFINEPPQYEDQRMVRDYRHELARLWMPLHDKINAAFSQSHEAVMQTRIETLEFELKAARNEIEIADGEIERLKAKAGTQEPVAPRVTDNDAGEITVTLNGKELRGWSYANDVERRAKMLAAREYVEGYCDGRDK